MLLVVVGQALSLLIVDDFLVSSAPNWTDFGEALLPPIGSINFFVVLGVISVGRF